jgi:hypothetical protein
MKRILLDTNIIIHRESGSTKRQDIGVLFNWLDKLHFVKCIHPLTIREIRGHRDKKIVESFNAKLLSYNELKTTAPDTPEIARIRSGDATANSETDTSILNELFSRRVDYLVTEDRGIHRKSKVLGIDSLVFTIDGFLEKVTAENPALVAYEVLAVEQQFFGNLNLRDSFFDSFMRDYPGFTEWFNRKADEQAYICQSNDGEMQAFLYLKQEYENEPYADIDPPLRPLKRLKIGTFKVTLNGHKLGERFLKIVFDNAVATNSSEIYVTIFDRDPDQQRLIALLEDWGFIRHGFKRGVMGDELVLVRDFRPLVNSEHPSLSYPYMGGNCRKFIVPIYPAYHTELLPDSILRTEDPGDFEGNRPNRNALRKVYISRSIERSMRPGEIIVFYRTAASGASAYYTSVATTLGIVDSVHLNIPDFETFKSLCRKRSVFSDNELQNHWDYRPNMRPFVVNFLHTHSFPKRPNLKTMLEAKIIGNAPRGFEEMSDANFLKLLTLSHANQSLVVY